MPESKLRYEILRLGTKYRRIYYCQGSQQQSS